MTDADFIVATAHLVEEAARKRPHPRTKVLAEYGRRRVREILAARAAEREGEG